MPLLELRPKSISQRHYFGANAKGSTTLKIETVVREASSRKRLPIKHWHPVVSSKFAMEGSFAGDFEAGMAHKVQFNNIKIDARNNGYIEYIPNLRIFRCLHPGVYHFDAHLDLSLSRADLRKLVSIELRLYKYSPHLLQPIHLQRIPMKVDISIPNQYYWFAPFACLQGSGLISLSCDDFVYLAFSYQRETSGSDLNLDDQFTSEIYFELVEEKL